MKIGKDKVYTYYRLFEQGLSVEEIYSNYKKNKHHCGRKELILSERKLEEIQHLLAQQWLLDVISDCEKFMNHPERASIKTLYKLVKQGGIEAKLS